MGFGGLQLLAGGVCKALQGCLQRWHLLWGGEGNGVICVLCCRQLHAAGADADAALRRRR